MQTLACSKGLAKPVSASPQAEAFYRTRSVKIIIFAAPLEATFPKIKTPDRSNPRRGEINIHHLRLSHESHAIAHLRHPGAPVFGQGHPGPATIWNEYVSM